MYGLIGDAKGKCNVFSGQEPFNKLISNDYISLNIQFPHPLVQLFHSSSALTLDTSFNKTGRLHEGASLELAPFSLVASQWCRIHCKKTHYVISAWNGLRLQSVFGAQVS